MNKKIILLYFIFLLLSSKMYSQGATCATATPFCTSVGTPFTYANITTGGLGSVGCLQDARAPNWFIVKTTTPGTYVFDLTQSTTPNGSPNIDVDFIAYGPYPSPQCAFGSGGGGLASDCSSIGAPYGDVEDCSYCWDPTETMTLNPTSNCQVFMVLITNYSRTAGYITFSQTSGPSTDCNITSAGNPGWTAPAPMCTSGAPIDLNTLLSGGSTTGGTWSGTGVVGSIFNPVTAGSGTFTITYTLSTGTCPTEESHTITVSNSTPTSVAGSDQSLCTTSTTLAGNTPPIGTGTWTLLSGSGTITSPTSPTSSVTSLGIGANAFQWTITSSCGAPSSDTVIINVNPTTNIPPNAAGPFVCGGAPQPITTSATAGGIWSASCGSCINSSTGVFDPIAAGSGSHSISYDVGFPTCESGSISVVVDACPPLSVCYDGSNFIATGGNGVYTWAQNTGFLGTWQDVGTGSPISASVFDLSKKIRITSSDGGTITYNALADVPSCGSLLVCYNGFDLVASNGVPVYTWSICDTPTSAGCTSWTVVSTGTNYTTSSTTDLIKVVDSNGNQSILNNGITGIAPCAGCNATISQVGPYCIADPSVTLSAIDLGGVWSGTGITDASTGVFNPSVSSVGSWVISYTLPDCSDTLIITVNPAATPTFNTVAPICSGDALSPLPTTSNNGITGTWSPGIDNTITTTYTFTPDAGQCGIETTLTIVVNPNPTLVITNPQPVCSPNTIDVTTALVTAGSSAGSFSYWTNPSGTNPLTNPSSILTSATYYIQLTAANGCQTIEPVTVIINNTPVLLITNPNPACSPNTVNLTLPSITSGSTSDGTLTYWQDAGTTTSLNSPQSISSSGTYYIQSTTGAGCSAIEPVNVSILQPPIPTIGADNLLGCAPVCVNFSDLTTDTITTWNWTFGNEGNSTNSNPTHCFTSVGQQNVVLSATAINGCSATSSPITILVHPTPIANFSTSSSTISMIDGDSIVLFYNQSSPDVVSWYWDFGSGETLSPDQPNPFYGYPFSNGGNYNTTLTVYNAFGCSNFITKEIIVEPYFTFYIPNVFSPDFDGKNDTFHGMGIGILKYKISIFDRWGELIFETEDINKGWDGVPENGSQIAQQDVYVWKVILEDIFHKKHDYIGTVTIIK